METTSEQRDSMTAVRCRVDRARSTQDLDPKTIAATSELCDRLVAANPEIQEFVLELAAIADHEASEAFSKGLDDIPWLALSQCLRAT